MERELTVVEHFLRDNELGDGIRIGHDVKPPPIPLQVEGVSPCTCTPLPTWGGVGGEAVPTWGGAGGEAVPTWGGAGGEAQLSQYLGAKNLVGSIALAVFDGPPETGGKEKYAFVIQQLHQIMVEIASLISILKYKYHYG